MTLRRGLVAALVWLALVWAAAAQPVPVLSGEHDGFTRLALTFGAPVEWRLERRADGYALSVAGEPRGFDLARVFQRIGRDRLAEVWVEPETGALRLGVACACNALPFEYRPGVLVIDLRDGPPPEASVFELAPDGTRMAALTQRAPFRPRGRAGLGAGVPADRAGGPRAAPEARAGGPPATGYDWIAMVTGDPLPPPIPEAARPPDQPVAPWRRPDRAPAGDPGFADLRRALVEDLARGAVEGTVSLQVPLRPTGVAVAAAAQVRISAADDLAAMIGLRAAGAGPVALAADGAACLADEALALVDWGDPRPVATAIGPLTSGLYGEFDRVNAEAAARAARYLLSLGFGAEVRGMIRSLGLTGDEAALWASMGRVVDGETDPGGAFAGMAACDTAAALWSVLADAAGADVGPVNEAAVLRAFSDLPPALRRHLGRGLADRMLARGDTANARAILQAMERMPEGAGPGGTLVAATLAAGQGQTPDLAALAALRTGTGPDAAAATVALIRDALSANGAVDPALITETEARLMEFAGTPEAAPLRQALAEAQASQGNFPRAFELAGSEGPGATPVWAILADRGGLASLLHHAVLPAGTAPPALPGPVRRALSRRLLDAGFAEAAMVWAGGASGTPPPLPASMEAADRLLIAEAQLLRRDAAAAMRQLQGLEAPEADALRLAAMAMAGDPAAPALADTLGDGAAADAIARRAGNWTRVAQTGPEAWRLAAARALPARGADLPGPTSPAGPSDAGPSDAGPPASAPSSSAPSSSDPSASDPAAAAPAAAGLSGAAEPGAALPPLARSRALLAESAAARADLAALMSATGISP